MSFCWAIVLSLPLFEIFMQLRVKQYIILLILIFATAPFSVAQIHQKIEDTLKTRYKLNPIVVTGGGHHQYLKKSAVRVRVLSSVEIAEEGISNVEDALLRMLPQVQMAPSSMGSFLRLNGLGNKYMLVLVDGKRLTGDMGGNVDIGRIELSRVKRIEILDGAASALYGSDAIGGVVNIITKQAGNEPFMVQYNSKFGGKGIMDNSLMADINVGGFSSSTSYTFSKADSYSNNGYEEVIKDGKTTLVETIAPLFTGYRTNLFGQNFSYKFSEDFVLKASFDYSGKITDRPDTREDIKGGTDYEMRHRTYRGPFGGIYRFAGRNVLQFNAGYDNYSYGREYDVESKEYRIGEYTRTKLQRAFYANLHSISHFGRGGGSTTIIGLDYRNDYLNASSGNVDNSLYTLAAYLQHEDKIAQGLKYEAGGRATLHKEFGLHFTPKLALLYSVGNFNTRFSYSMGYRSPGLDELYYNYFGLYRSKPQISFGSKDLLPERSNYISLNEEYLSEKFNLSVTGYLNYIDRMIIKKNVPATEADKERFMKIFPQMTKEQADKLEHYALYSNSNKGEVKGVNISLNTFITNEFSLGAAYSYTYARYKDEAGWSFMERSVLNSATFNVGYSKIFGNYILNVRLSARAQGKTKYPGYESAPGYGIVNLNTTHTFNLKRVKLEPNIGIDNLFNKKDMRPDASLRKYALYSPGRVLFAGLRVQFK